MHECCDSCMGKCECNTCNCGMLWSPKLDDECYIPVLSIGKPTNLSNKLSQTVTSKDRQLLKKKLYKLQQDMLSEVQVKTMVTCPQTSCWYLTCFILAKCWILVTAYLL